MRWLLAESKARSLEARVGLIDCFFTIGGFTAHHKLL